MTRETKIGLLVGLAFIIVIGILLSDHMTSTTQPPQAQLTEAAPNVRESVTAPAASGAGATPTQVVTGQPITPSNPVLTPTEIRQPAPVVPAQQPVTKVEVGGPAVVPQQAQTPVQVAVKTPEVVTPAPTPTPTGGDSNTSELEKWAAKVGEPVVPVGAKPQAAKPASTVGAKQKEYTAVAGDSLSKIAAKTLGSGSKANIELLIKANPSLQKNPDLVVEGRKYIIPSVTSPTPETAVTTAAEKKSVPMTELVDPIPAPATPKDGTSWYTVKENDNLWKIASEQLGSGNAWTQIKELNKDVLKGGDTVQKNMRLKLPPKPLASAN